jgi:hypothetical protein
MINELNNFWKLAPKQKKWGKVVVTCPKLHDNKIQALVTHTSWCREKAHWNLITFWWSFHSFLSLMVIPIWQRNSRYGKRALNQLALHWKGGDHCTQPIGTPLERRRPGNGWRSENDQILLPNCFWIFFFSNQMNHQCGWTNSHSTAGKSDPPNGEVDQPTKLCFQMYFFFRLNEWIINVAAKLKSFAMKLNWQLFVQIQ